MSVQHVNNIIKSIIYNLNNKNKQKDYINIQKEYLYQLDCGYKNECLLKDCIDENNNFGNTIIHNCTIHVKELNIINFTSTYIEVEANIIGSTNYNINWIYDNNFLFTINNSNSNTIKLYYKNNVTPEEFITNIKCIATDINECSDFKECQITKTNSITPYTVNCVTSSFITCDSNTISNINLLVTNQTINSITFNFNNSDLYTIIELYDSSNNLLHNASGIIAPYTFTNINPLLIKYVKIRLICPNGIETNTTIDITCNPFTTFTKNYSSIDDIHTLDLSWILNAGSTYDIIIKNNTINTQVSINNYAQNNIQLIVFFDGSSWSSYTGNDFSGYIPFNNNDTIEISIRQKCSSGFYSNYIYQNFLVNNVVSCNPYIVTWTQINPTTLQYNINNYTLGDTFNIYKNGVLANNVPLTGNVGTLAGLNPNTSYSLYIQRICESGNINSTTQNITTLDVEPCDIPILNITSITNNGFTIGLNNPNITALNYIIEVFNSSNVQIYSTMGDSTIFPYHVSFSTTYGTLKVKVTCICSDLSPAVYSNLYDVVLPVQPTYPVQIANVFCDLMPNLNQCGAAIFNNYIAVQCESNTLDCSNNPCYFGNGYTTNVYYINLNSGTIIYTNNILTIPLLGKKYMRLNNNNIYHLNPLTGAIINILGTC